MDDEFEAMEIGDDLPEFTLAETIQMEKLFKEMRKEPISQEFCERLSAKFNCSTHRSETYPIKWEQVRSWFQDKQKKSAAKVIPSSDQKDSVAKVILPPALKWSVDFKAAVLKKRVKVPTISASQAAVELPNLIFEARSAKDYAWFDVGSFLNYRVLSSGELLVRVRFAGFGKEEDEWVSVKWAVRERSIPLEPSECGRVDVGDLVLCFREAEDHALYCDAHVLEIQRKPHGSSGCTCIFVVHYDHDSVEGKVSLDKLCCRPSKEIEDCKPAIVDPNGMLKLL